MHSTFHNDRDHGEEKVFESFDEFMYLYEKWVYKFEILPVKFPKLKDDRVKHIYLV